VSEKLEETLKEACAVIFRRFPAIENEISEIILQELHKARNGVTFRNEMRPKR
jgi:hypothetical protein